MVRASGDAAGRGQLGRQRLDGGAVEVARRPGGPDIDGGAEGAAERRAGVDTVEKGLKAAKAAGVPVDLEGVEAAGVGAGGDHHRLRAGTVAPKKPVPPPKPVPAVSPLGKAAAKPAEGEAGGGHRAARRPAAGAPVRGGCGRRPAVGGPAAAAAGQATRRRARRATPRSPRSRRTSRRFAKAKRAHPPAASKAKEAQDAALAPTDDLTGQAKAAKADTMDAQQPGTFDKKAFIAAVKAAIEAKSPKTLKEADNYKESGKAGEVKGEVKGLVTQGKEGQAKDIEAATEAPPDQSKAVPKPVTPMGPEQPGQAGADPGGRCGAEAGAARAAQPRGRQARGQQGDGRGRGHRDAARGVERAAVRSRRSPTRRPPPRTPTRRRASSASRSSRSSPQGKADAAAETKEGVAGMQGAKGAALAKLVADKGKAKSKDEAKRAEVTAKIQGIFNATEADVKKILDGIDPKVEKEFERRRGGRPRGVRELRRGQDVGVQEGPLRRLARQVPLAARDKISGMPDKVNEFYVAGRELYLKEMDKVISRVADIVGDDLTAAKKRIAAGRTEIATYVKSLPKDLKKVGSEASKEIGERFEQLESEVDAKQESVVDTLATKYVEARKGSTSGSRSCRPRTGAWSTRRSARSRPSSTRSASSRRC